MLSKISKKYLGTTPLRGAPVTITQQQAKLFHTSSSSNTYLSTVAVAAKATVNGTLFSRTARFGFSTEADASDAAQGFKTVHPKRYQSNGERYERRQHSQDGGERRQRANSSSSGLTPGVLKNFNKDLPIDEAIADVAQKIKIIEGLTDADTFALLRYVNRSMSKREGGADSFESKRLPNDEEFRKNINIIAQQANKVIEQVTPKNLSEFSNFLNVLRITEADAFVPNYIRMNIVKKINTAFGDPKFAEEFKEMTFEQSAKIFSDLVHHTSYLFPSGTRLVSLLPRTQQQRKRLDQDSLNQQDLNLRDVPSAVKVLDQMSQVDLAFENADFVVRRLERYLRETAIYEQLTVTQKARLLRAFARANHELLVSFPILSKLTRDLYQNIEKLQPSDVGHILKAYQYMAPDIKNSNRLIRDLNNSVVISASNYPDNVNIQFLLNYLSSMFVNNQGGNTSRDLDKEQRDKLIQLLEGKITRPDQYANNSQILITARVLIRHPHSGPIRTFLENGLKKFARRLSFEELNTGLYALNQSAIKQFKEEAGSKVKPVELEILSQLKDAKTKNLKVLAERICFLDSQSLKKNTDAQELQKELWATFQELSKDGMKGFTRTDAVLLLTKVYPRLGDNNSQVVQDLVSYIAQTQLATAEQLKGTPINNILDLLIFLQRPTRKNQGLRTTLMPLLQERVSNLSPQGLEMYIRRVINIQDYLPQSEYIALNQMRNIFDTIDKQASADTVKGISPLLLYKLAERFIHDAKVAGKSAKTSSSRMIEKNRIDQIVNMLLSKLSRDDAIITEHFIDSLVFTSVNLNEVPTYFKTVLRAKINNTIKKAPAAPKEGEQSDSSSPLNDEQLLASLAALRLFVSPLTATQQNNLVDFLKSAEGKLNLNRLRRDFANENRSGYIEGSGSSYDSMVIRGLRVVNKIQQRNIEQFKDSEDSLVTNEFIAEVAQNILAQAIKQSENGRHSTVLNFLSALSDYPDTAFNYEENEQKINKLIKESYKNLSIRQAFLPFLLTQADERAQNSRKLSQKLMKEFSIVYKTTLNEASTSQITKIAEKFTKHNWLIADTYNSLIKAFGEKFEEFSFRELASFNKSLSQVGLKQVDIVAASIDRLRTNAGYNAKKDLSAEAAPVEDDSQQQLSNYQVSFSKVIIPFLETIVNLDLVGQQQTEAEQLVDLVSQLTEESFIKRAIPGELSFFEQALREGVDNQHLILSALLKGRLDQTDPRFKALAEQLVDKLNGESVVIDEATQDIYQVLNQGGESPLSGKRFSPKNIESIKNAVQRDNRARDKQSQLYQQAKVEAAIKALGYEDVAFYKVIGEGGDGFKADFYSPAKNAVFLTLDSATLNYDRKTPNGTFRLRERVAKSLPGSPSVHTINVFELFRSESNEDKVKYLQTEAGIPLVAESVNLEAFGASEPKAE